MSGFIGLDPERIGWLCDAMRRANEELLRAETSDPAAELARTRLRRARALIADVWLPMLEHVIAGQAHPSGEPSIVLHFGLDFENAGWNLFGPAPADRSTLTADQLERAAIRDEREAVADAIELAERLGGDAAWDLSTSDLDRLTELCLEIATRPVAAGAFRSAFDGWEELTSALATGWASIAERATDDPDDRDAQRQLGRYDGLFAALGAVLSSGSLEVHRPAAPPILAQLDPYAAALLLPHLGLHGVMLANLATQLVRRWHDNPFGATGGIDFAIVGDNTIDLVFRELANDPDAATHFLEGAIGHPQTIVLGVRNPESAERLLRVGTDPTRVDPAVAGAIIIPVIDWLRDGWTSVNTLPPGTTMLSKVSVADVLSAWVLHLGPRAEQWGWTFEEGDDALRWVIEDDAALERFVDGLHAADLTLGDLPFSDAQGRINDLLVQEQTEMFAQLESAIADEQVDDAADGEFWIDLAFASVRLLASNLIMPTATGMTAFARDASVSAAVALTRRTLERNHLLPTTAADVEKQVRRDRDQRRVDRAVIATVGVVAQLVELGDLDPSVLGLFSLVEPSADEGACIARQTEERLSAWVASLESQLSPPQFNLVVAVRNGFLNQTDIVEMCH